MRRITVTVIASWIAASSAAAEPIDFRFDTDLRRRVKAVNERVMHACGHDAHTAILLGAAHIRSDLREELPGTVLLLFQPAEETCGWASDPWT